MAEVVATVADGIATWDGMVYKLWQMLLPFICADGMATGSTVYCILSYFISLFISHLLIVFVYYFILSSELLNRTSSYM